MDVQEEGEFKTVMSWKGEVEYLWDVRRGEEGLFSISFVRQTWIFSVSYILSCMVDSYLIILKYNFPYVIATLQNFNYQETLLVERSQMSLMMQGFKI